MKARAIRVVECSYTDFTYGFLFVKNSDVSTDDIQEKISEIKSEFERKGIDDWCIEDVFEKFPTDWEWEFVTSFTRVLV